MLQKQDRYFPGSFRFRPTKTLLAVAVLSMTACDDRARFEGSSTQNDGSYFVGGAGGTGGAAGWVQPEAGSGAPAAGTGGSPAVSTDSTIGSTAPPSDSGGTGGLVEGGIGGAGGEIVAGGTGGAAGAGDLAGTGGSSGNSGAGGIGGAGGTGGTGSTHGTCCADGDCLCRGSDPTELTAANGPYQTASYTILAGTVFYPTDAEPPFAGVAVCGGYMNFGPEMAGWGTFYASHGIVTVITSTLPTDTPPIRADKLLAAIAELKGENTKAGSPLEGKLSDRFGTSGYSMGGGGTTIASGDDPSLSTSIGLAAWQPEGRGVQVPTLLLCGSADTTAPCSYSTGAYSEIPSSTPKLLLAIQGGSHLTGWFNPTTGAGLGTSGKYALAFQKVFLEGDERWKPLLLVEPADATDWRTNIQ